MHQPRTSAPSSQPSPPVAGADPGLYTRLTMMLRYTPQVIWWRHPHVWGVPNGLIHARYAGLTGRLHVEVGVGNGHFLTSLPRWTPAQQIHLVDANPACLRLTARRLRGRFHSQTHLQSALDPWSGVADSSADSVACHMTLHAIQRRDMAALAPLMVEARRVLAPGGMFFGSTIVPEGGDVSLTRAARRIIAEYNQSGTFANADDTLDGLRDLLSAHFTGHVRLRVFGCVAVWEATS